MYRYIIGSLAILFFLGCAQKNIQIPHKQSPKEDALLFQAVFLEYSGANGAAARFYEKLYHIDPNPYYLKRIIYNLIKAKEYDKALVYIESALKKEPNDPDYLSLAATLYFAKKVLQKAKEYLLKTIRLRKSAQDYQLLASIYLMQKQYKKALKYLKSAYALDHSPHTVNSMAYILYFYLDRQKDAIAYLETHSRIYGCERSFCLTLASLYGDRNDISGLISVYKRLYARYKDQQYAKKLIKLYLYQKEYDKAIRYVQELGDDALLLEIYREKKDYAKAKELADKLYKRTKDLKYLAQSAIFEYEMADDKKDPKLLKSVAKKLEKVVHTLDDPVYLNYLGYLYIDNDMNIKRGIELVKKALKAEPNSPFYIDSLAWGYYKIGKCDEAFKLIKKVFVDMNLKDPEVELHFRKIQQCKERH